MTWEKFFRRTVSLLFIISILSFASITRAEVYTGEGSYVMSEGENLGVAKERAKADAMRNAAEKAGTYVKSYTRTKNLVLEEDVIETMTANILKPIENPKFYPLKEVDNLEGILIRVTVKVQIDDSDINRWLNKNEQEKSMLVEQNEALRKANAEQERQITELKRQLSQATTKQAKETITENFAAEDKKFLSNQKVDEAQRLFDKGDYDGAIKLCNEAIDLNYYNPLPYGLRGLVYLHLNQDKQFHADSKKAIELLKAESYKDKGDSYFQSAQYELAIQCYDNAIEIKQNDAELYKNRGIAYVGFGVHYLTTNDYERARKSYERAFPDFNKAIELNPNDAVTWCGLGTACSALGKNERAIIDFNRALKLDPNFAEAYFKRCMIYVFAGNFEVAIADITKVIELEPNNGMYWKIRGGLYKQLGYEAKAQADFAKAKQLGYNG